MEYYLATIMTKNIDTPFCWTETTLPKKKVDLAGIARANAMNKTGHIHYNKFGKRDGQGFEQCSEMFIDNFLLRTLVPDYHKDKKCYTKIGSLNKAIREELDEFGIKTCRMKAVNQLYQVAERVTDEMKCAIRERDRSLETKDTKYFWQDVKVSCPNIDAKIVLDFLRQHKYTKLKVQLKDIDFTIDYAGSFDKDEVIDYMIQTNDFRLQGSDEPGYLKKTIVDNDRYVGRNCLTYMDESPDGCSVRCKLYNKMVQMLESRSVASTLGNNWKKWVDQSVKDYETGGRADTRLVIAKDKATERGLTRAEVTFNCREELPSDKDIEFVLHQITKFVPPSLVYSTPYSATWFAYCDTFVHSLVLVEKGEEEEDRALIVHSYNEVTQKISGVEIENWNKEWCLANLTLSSVLPIDIINVNFLNLDEETGKKTHNVTMSRWMKHHPKAEVFKTRLVLPGSMFSHSNHSKVKCQELLTKSGFLPHNNCIPELANKKCNRNSCVAIQLEFLENLKPKKKRSMAPKQDIEYTLEMIKNSTLDRITKIRKQMSLSARINKDFIESKIKYTGLTELSFGSYDVLAVKAYGSQFGVKYMMYLEKDREKFRTASNKKVEETLQRLLPVHIMQLVSTNGVVHTQNYEEGPIGKLCITGHGWTITNNRMAHCTFGLSLPMLGNIKQARKLLQVTTMGKTEDKKPDAD